MGKRRKVKLPRDRNGVPIDVGDWLAFSDGTLHVSMLGFMGDKGGWYAESEDGDYSDNLSAAVVLNLPKGEK